jgi:uroporphyrin-III C-methyltransferase
MNQGKGKVVFIGAGPGDPELLTMKGFNWLQKAEVVLSDRLVSEVILNEYVNPEAEIIYVGKQCRTGYSTPQSTINELLVLHASRGKLVVRLKGGDVSIFSNILDELISLKDSDIPFEIVPGITAASGAAAYAGIPLTARNYSTAVRFLTYYKSDVISENYWRELSATNDTLVFYMSSGTLSEIVDNLIQNNIGKDKKIAVIEQATTPFQNIRIGSAYDFKNNPVQYLASPTLIVIGNVTVLHEQFKWVNNFPVEVEYFKEGFSKSIEKEHSKVNF